MEHSKTPWKIGAPPPNGEQTIGTIEGLMVAVTTTGAGVDSEANARRIVACVNACAGLDTEYLETVGLPEFAGKTLCVDLAQQELSRVVEQRDQLLAVLEGLLEEVAGCMCTHEMPARAVIQKVRGGE